jgi:hypothetical protein
VKLVIPYEYEGARSYITIHASGTTDRRKLRRILRWVARKKLGWSLTKSLLDALIKSSVEYEQEMQVHVTPQSLDEMCLKLNAEADEQEAEEAAALQRLSYAPT